MIAYRRGAFNILFRVLQMKGSVFPFAALVALPGAVLSFVLKYAMEEGFIPGLTRFEESSILKSAAIWSSFSFLVGFLIVFRTSQAYTRFWDGCSSTHRMRAEWYDACSSLIAFCRHSRRPRAEVERFEHILVRLFSMLHAVALAEIEDSSSDDVHEIAAFKYELVDAASIDTASLNYIKDSDSRVELLYQWIQQLVVDQIATQMISIPPPLLSRSFQELANGMCQFHEAIKISTIPFPFPYAQTCDCCLGIQFLMTPLIITQFVTDPWWAAAIPFDAARYFFQNSHAPCQWSNSRSFFGGRYVNLISYEQLSPGFQLLPQRWSISQQYMLSYGFNSFTSAGHLFGTTYSILSLDVRKAALEWR